MRQAVRRYSTADYSSLDRLAIVKQLPDRELPSPITPRYRRFLYNSMVFSDSVPDVCAFRCYRLSSFVHILVIFSFLMLFVSYLFIGYCDSGVLPLRAFCFLVFWHA